MKKPLIEEPLDTQAVSGVVGHAIAVFVLGGFIIGVVIFLVYAGVIK